MAWLISFTLTILVCGNVINAYLVPKQEFTRQRFYWQLRWRLMMDEWQQSLGGKLKLNPVEVIANRVLMSTKNQEIYDGLILLLS